MCLRRARLAMRAAVVGWARLEVGVDEIRALAGELVDWLSQKVGVTSVQPPIFAQKAAKHSRLAFHRPGPKAPAFEIKFIFKNQPRRFRYFIENVDDHAAMINTLRVHSNGELLIRVPDGTSQLWPNDIHYGSRSVAAAALGEEAPS
jgi:hypothetical protein